MPAEQFSLKIDQFVKKAKAAPDIVLRKVCLDMFSRIVMRNPVGNPSGWHNPHPPKGYVGGRSRGNWQCTIGEPAGGETSIIDPSGSAAITSMSGVVSNAKLGEDIWFVNNVPYANRLEHGWSKQAPAGMVSITVQEFQSLVDQASAEVKAE